jgi:hypothetical protein
MKKDLSKGALMKEASFWSNLKRSIKENPNKVCQK